MKRTSLFVGLGLAVLVGTIAWAAPAPATDLFRWVKGGLTIGRSSTPPSATYDPITDSRGKYFAYDWPAIGPGGAGQAGGHLEGPGPIAVPGARVGDNCMVASDRTTYDGGKPRDLLVTCEVILPGYVHIRADAQLADAGSIDPVDAGYYFRTFSMTVNP